MKDRKCIYVDTESSEESKYAKGRQEETNLDKELRERYAKVLAERYGVYREPKVKENKYIKPFMLFLVLINVVLLTYMFIC